MTSLILAASLIGQCPGGACPIQYQYAQYQYPAIQRAAPRAAPAPPVVRAAPQALTREDIIKLIRETVTPCNCRQTPPQVAEFRFH